MTLTYPDGTTEAKDTEANGCYTWTVTKPGDYKVTEEVQTGWTPQGATFVDFKGVKSGDEPYSHTFTNFKNVTITACKENTEQVAIPGWEMTLTYPDASTDKQKTDDKGCYTWTVTKPGDYKVTEEVQTGWTAQGATFVEFKGVKSGDEPYSYTFVNFKNVEITGCKIKDNDGSYVSGWTLYLWKDGALFDTKTTGPNGCYTWTVTTPGDYQIKEGSWNFWTPVGPTESDIWDVTSGSGPFSVDFTNYRQLGCAYTQGYWKTHADIEKKYDSTWDLVGGPYAELLNSGLWWIDVFNTPPKGGNPWYILAHQYMAAKLNFYWGADTTMVDEYITKAEMLLSTYPPASDFKKDPSVPTAEFISTAAMLDTFNNGYNYPAMPGWPPHCN
jgi:hypothetical protein